MDTALSFFDRVLVFKSIQQCVLNVITTFEIIINRTVTITKSNNVMCSKGRL